MPATFDKLGIHFLYPDNWTLAEEQREDLSHCVTVETPGGGYWELRIFSARMNPAKLAAQVLQAMRDEYADLEAQAITEDLDDVRAVGYDMTFFCLDFVVISQIRCLCVGARTFVLTYQAESREFDRQRPVFEAMTHSLLTAKARDRKADPSES